jgi:hypothetical protein
MFFCGSILLTDKTTENGYYLSPLKSEPAHINTMQGVEERMSFGVRIHTGKHDEYQQSFSIFCPEICVPITEATTQSPRDLISSMHISTYHHRKQNKSNPSSDRAQNHHERTQSADIFRYCASLG